MLFGCATQIRIAPSTRETNANGNKLHVQLHLLFGLESACQIRAILGLTMCLMSGLVAPRKPLSKTPSKTARSRLVAARHRPALSTVRRKPMQAPGSLLTTNRTRHLERPLRRQSGGLLAPGATYQIQPWTRLLPAGTPATRES